MTPHVLFALALASVVDSGSAGRTAGRLYADILSVCPNAKPSAAVVLRNSLVDLGFADPHSVLGSDVIIATAKGRELAAQIREVLS